MRIVLDKMRFYAYHGFFEEERTIGNDFVVTVSLDVDCFKAQVSDELSDTLNYQQVYDAVKQEMTVSSKLLEHVARRILNRLKKLQPSVRNVRVELSKVNPPLGGQVDSVTLILEE